MLQNARLPEGYMAVTQTGEEQAVRGQEGAAAQARLAALDRARFVSAGGHVALHARAGTDVAQNLP